MNEDWGHLGIASPLIVRRLDIAMQEYRVRFERKQVCVRNYSKRRPGLALMLRNK